MIPAAVVLLILLARNSEAINPSPSLWLKGLSRETLNSVGGKMCEPKDGPPQVLEGKGSITDLVERVDPCDLIGRLIG
jgi:hypothetical protein